MGSVLDLDVDVVVQDGRPEVVRSMLRAGVDQSKPMMPLEAIMRFTNSGIVPSVGGGQIRR